METAIYALLGALLLIAIQLKAEKDKRDRNPKLAKQSWKVFLGKNWDDFVFALICAVVLGYLQEDVYSALIHWREWDEDASWDVYYDTEFLISASLGIFGTLIIQKFYRLGSKVIKST